MGRADGRVGLRAGVAGGGGGRGGCGVLAVGSVVGLVADSNVATGGFLTLSAFVNNGLRQVALLTKEPVN